MPAMLLFPTLFLFIYLIFETTKLSREKIRHQFAIDAAAFVEATNYSDFLNRTAYVNGAFPMRIFEQAYAGVQGNGSVNAGDIMWADCEGKTESCTNMSYADILYQNGIFPRDPAGAKHIFTNEPEWDIAYGGPVGGPKNSASPTMPETVVLFSIADANRYWHHWNLATEIYKLYRQVFQLLGSVEDAQFKVLEKLTKGTPSHSFLQKSYWLNTGDAPSYGQQLAQAWDSQLGDFTGTPHCVRKLVYHGNKELAGNALQQYRIMGTDPPVDLSGVSAICDRVGGGLFQLMTVDDRFLRAFNSPNGSEFPGLSLELPWQYPRENYFNVNFPQPTIHTTVAIGVPDGTTKPAVWPKPTPKFQVRTFP